MLRPYMQGPIGHTSFPGVGVGGMGGIGGGMGGIGGGMGGIGGGIESLYGQQQHQSFGGQYPIGQFAQQHPLAALAAFGGGYRPW